MRNKAILMLLVIGLALGSFVSAEVPKLINYQGLLTDLSGEPLEGTHDLLFQIHPDSVSTYVVWDELHGGIEVVEGLFNVILGHSEPLEPDLFSSAGRWLSITVDDGAEIRPRMRLTSVPWAHRGAVADSALAVDWDDVEHIPAGFADGVDDVGGSGDGHSLDASDGDPIDAVYVDDEGSVGIGTTSPSATLDVRGALHVGEDAQGHDVNFFGSVAGSRLTWFGEKMALRAGRDPLGNCWAPDSVGLYSTAAGLSAKATADYATAFGGTAEARGVASTATGWFATADGNYSVAMGRLLTAAADNSIVLGSGLDVANRLTNTTPNSFMIGFNDTEPTLFAGGPDQYVGIGTREPDVRLDVSDVMRIMGLNYGGSSYPSTGQGMELAYRPSDNTGLIQVYDRDASAWGTLFLGDGDVGIGTMDPEEKLHVEGTIKCAILKLTGGSDIAEPFNVEEGTTVRPGMVMTIDTENPGKLKVADRAYDRCVAGVVSGANHVQPGLIMTQEGSPADGEHPIALTGRVYCWVDASHGSIEPGDLLTTSSTPGHAMKAGDHTRAPGAVLGKAMSTLATGRGLVLVLISLQ